VLPLEQGAGTDGDDTIAGRFSGVVRQGVTVSRTTEAGTTTVPGAAGFSRSVATLRRLFAGGAVVLGLAAATVAAAASAAQPAGLRAELQSALAEYLETYGEAEHISGLSAFVSRHDGDAGIAATVGTTKWPRRGAPLTPDTLFQIGSNTKAFTSVLLLRLETEGRLDIDDTVGDHLPQYPAWKKVPIRRLLNMTSGLPTYSEAPRFMKHQAADPDRHYTLKELVAYAYPSKGNDLPDNTGWFYSNTNYILAGMIVEKLYRRPYEEVIRQEIFKPLGLHRTYYAERKLPGRVLDRAAGGYFDNPVCSLYTPDCKVGQLQPLVGLNLQRADLSWAGPAGGIVSTPKDLTTWIRHLFAGRVLPKRQMKELLTLVSSATGKPIDRATAADPRGFSLGLAQLYEKGVGSFWFYEGETLGYRAVFAYYPKEDLVISVFLNSQPSDDHVGELMDKLHAMFTR
jgi:D-alanyl-D-alanine carboxypeptidase